MQEPYYYMYSVHNNNVVFFHIELFVWLLIVMAKNMVKGPQKWSISQNSKSLPKMVEMPI